MSNDPIANALNLTPVTSVVTPRATRPSTPNSKIIDAGDESMQLENDFEYARRNMYDIIEKGSEALNGILDVAEQSQHARSYEVAANLIKTMSEVNKDLLDLAKKKRDLMPKDDTPSTPGKVTNNLFVGSTAELQAMLKKASEE